MLVHPFHQHLQLHGFKFHFVLAVTLLSDILHDKFQLCTQNPHLNKAISTNIAPVVICARDLS